jgi:hypothetical protein
MHPSHEICDTILDPKLDQGSKGGCMALIMLNFRNGKVKYSVFKRNEVYFVLFVG